MTEKGKMKKSSMAGNTEIDQQTKSIIIRNLPEILHKNFKSLCAMEGVSLQDKIVELIREAVDGWRDRIIKDIKKEEQMK